MRQIMSILLFLAFLGNSTASSQERKTRSNQDSLKYPQERFSLMAGSFLTSINNDISVGGSQLGLGININVEDALGLSTSKFVARGEIEFNFGKRMRSRVRLSAYTLNRKSEKILESQIEIGDFIFPIGTRVSSRLNTGIYKADYDYAFFSDERIRLSASIGLYTMTTKFSINTLNMGGENADLIAPLPVIGTQSQFNVTPKFIIKQSLNVLYLRISSYEGSITDLNIMLEYLPFKNLGIGLGYDAFRFSLTAYEGNNFGGEFIGNLEINYSGLLMYGRLFF